MLKLTKLKTFYIIKGKRYTSIKEAAKDMKVDYSHLQHLIKKRLDSDGEAIRVIKEVIEVTGRTS